MPAEARGGLFSWALQEGSPRGQCPLRVPHYFWEERVDNRIVELAPTVRLSPTPRERYRRMAISPCLVSRPFWPSSLPWSANP